MSRKKPVDQMSLKIESRSVNESFARVARLGVCGSAGPDCRRNIRYQNRRQRGGHKLYRPRLSASVGEIYIWVGLFDDGLVRIRIRDRGCGIIDVRQAMEPLFTTLGGERAGLGFAVMESFMDKVRVRSVPGKGTSVTMDKFVKGRGDGQG